MKELAQLLSWRPEPSRNEPAPPGERSRGSPPGVSADSGHDRSCPRAKERCGCALPADFLLLTELPLRAPPANGSTLIPLHQ